MLINFRGSVRSSIFFCVKCSICVLNFRGWSQPRNYLNSEIFPIYGMYYTVVKNSNRSTNIHTTSTQTQIWTFGQFCGFVGFGEPGNETRVCRVHITHKFITFVSPSSSWKCCSA